MSFRLVLVCATLLALAACKKKPRYAVGDHLIPMGSSDPHQIVTVVDVDADSYKVSSAPSPRPNDPVQTKTRREIDSYYVRVDLPVGGSWLTEEDRAAALARMRTPTPVPTATPTPTASAALAESTPTPSGTPDPEALAPIIRPAMGLISAFDAGGKLLRNTTGFFISNDGRFVTTADAVSGAANGIVKVQSGAIYNVVGVLAISTTTNVAVLKVDIGSVPFLQVSQAPELRAGATVLIADTVLRRRSDAVVPAKITELRNEAGGEVLQLGGNKLQVSAGAAVVDGRGEVIGCVTREQAGDQVRSVRTVAAIDALIAQITPETKTSWPVAQRSATPAPSAATQSGGEATLVYAPLPRYPANARFSYGAPPSGTGRYTVKFGADGRPTGVVIVQSTGSQTLDNAALEALRSWRAKPGAPSQKTIPITFRRP